MENDVMENSTRPDTHSGEVVGFGDDGDPAVDRSDATQVVFLDDSEIDEEPDEGDYVEFVLTGETHDGNTGFGRLIEIHKGEESFFGDIPDNSIGQTAEVTVDGEEIGEAENIEMSMEGSLKEPEEVGPDREEKGIEVDVEGTGILRQDEFDELDLEMLVKGLDLLKTEYAANGEDEKLSDLLDLKSKLVDSLEDEE